ncbi:prolyl aminopeptidase [Qipengyuania flava]|uniref:prolyl aminopeptidase n=1 Tax=Qipengyuania flava TaxID=192812 RepID=UPI001C5A033A|nr:prolyl aminopeptidase [Qipengyuania flava]MBW3168459.1 prolyl aminopeptidase [Qipengyuania flava]MBY5965697.1 prolyl aminopeptidase [Qipengyuania flava]MBY6012021.1 prolyl aminopeptidase [Qipengyuania flava]MBY6026463.1 prolyl aminopeptidase [Qipengyuania flava]
MTETRRTLYPAIEPYETGMLDVGEGHSLYYERVGTPGAKPAVFLHGGPGGGMAPDHRRQWDPELYDVLLFDQRGCGKSQPFAEIEYNDTWRIVEDIERLRDMCGHEKWQAFGGSWGSTLALAYAQKYPERVSELVLRGVFLARQQEKSWLYSYGASEIMAEQWDQFTGIIPEAERGDLVRAYYERLTSDDEATRLEAAREWSLWEGHVATLLPNEELLDSFGDPAKAVPFARICAKFFLENFFLEENELLNNVDKLAGIPGIIVQGRHDICTPPGAAWALKKAWPEAEFWIVHDAGHSAGEPGIIDGLVRATDRLAGKEG